MSIRIQEQILLEIAMSLGSSLDLQKMLSRALSTYLRRLCCMGAAVLLRSDETARYDIRFHIPKKISPKGPILDFLALVNSCKDDHDEAELREKLPLYSFANGNHHYMFDLPTAGFLVIEKGLTPLSRSALNSLRKINIKLAKSITTCLIHHRNEVLNLSLKKQIAEREEIEKRLINERKKYRVIFENSPIGMVYFNHDGVIEDCNQRFAEIMGAERDVIIGLNTALYSSQLLRNTLGRALTGEPATYEGEYTSFIGRRTCRLRAHFNPVAAGNPNTEVIATVEEL
ncbi:PAS domain S-box protein [Maridesulfovibrio sp. FT414]|uniref:PAS domain S-box protein n=1 Tax=Maridesulfovibrio sp. FT414 TaxID=2979469 RepID=UPI003D8073DF